MTLGYVVPVCRIASNANLTLSKSLCRLESRDFILTPEKLTTPTTETTMIIVITTINSIKLKRHSREREPIFDFISFFNS